MDDLIGRQAVLDLLIENGIYGYEKKIAELPSIQPEPKTGHWKRISMDRYTEHAKYWYRCDRCGKDNLGNTDFCPSCGARMVEPQETKQPEISSYYGLKSYVRERSEE